MRTSKRKEERKGGGGRLGPEHLSTIISVTLGVLVDVKHMTSLFPPTDVTQFTPVF